MLDDSIGYSIVRYCNKNNEKGIFDLFELNFIFRFIYI